MTCFFIPVTPGNQTIPLMSEEEKVWRGFQDNFYDLTTGKQKQKHLFHLNCRCNHSVVFIAVGPAKLVS